MPKYAKQLNNEQTRQFPVRDAETNQVFAFVNILDDLETDVYNDMDANIDYYIENGQLVITNDALRSGGAKADISKFTKRPTK